MSEPIPVVAAVRYRDWLATTDSPVGKNRLYWTVRRTATGKHAGLAGMWEFPGGAIEPGETPERALQRELREEFDSIELVHVGKLLDEVITSSSGKWYRVLFYPVTIVGEPQLKIHDLEKWSTATDLLKQEHLPSGRKLIERLAADEREQILHNALVKYGSHHSTCTFWREINPRCSCGFAGVLKIRHRTLQQESALRHFFEEVIQ